MRRRSQATNTSTSTSITSKGTLCDAADHIETAQHVYDGIAATVTLTRVAGIALTIFTFGGSDAMAAEADAGEISAAAAAIETLSFALRRMGRLDDVRALCKGRDTARRLSDRRPGACSTRVPTRPRTPYEVRAYGWARNQSMVRRSPSPSCVTGSQPSISAACRLSRHDRSCSPGLAGPCSGGPTDPAAAASKP